MVDFPLVDRQEKMPITDLLGIPSEKNSQQNYMQKKKSFNYVNYNFVKHNM